MVRLKATDLESDFEDIRIISIPYGAIKRRGCKPPF